MTKTMNIQNTARHDAANAELISATLSFTGHADDFIDRSTGKAYTGIQIAGTMLREVVGWSPSLNRSFLGLHPKCDASIEFGRDHREIRRFTTEEGLKAYKDYLTNLIAKAEQLTPGLQPTLEDVGCDGIGFKYAVHSGRADISIRPNAKFGGWDVCGTMRFPSEEIAARMSDNLVRNGYYVEILSGGVCRGERSFLTICRGRSPPEPHSLNASEQGAFRGSLLLCLNKICHK